MLELRNVTTEAVSAKALKLGRVTAVNLTFNWESALSKDNFYLKCSIVGKLLESLPASGEEINDENVLALLTCSLVIDYQVLDKEGAEKLAAASEIIVTNFAEKNAIRDIFPFIREIVASMSARIGFAHVGVGALAASTI